MKNTKIIPIGSEAWITGNNTMHGFKIGQKVITGRYIDEMYRCYYPDKSDWWYVAPSDLTTINPNKVTFNKKKIIPFDLAQAKTNLNKVFFRNGERPYLIIVRPGEHEHDYPLHVMNKEGFYGDYTLEGEHEGESIFDLVMMA